PLAETLSDRVRYSSRVIGVGRKGRDLSVDAGRAEQPFVVHVRRADDTEERLEAKAVVDASGTWRAPSPAGAEGLPALGEQAAVEAGSLDHRTPSRGEAAELAGKHNVVVGSGHSAATAIGDRAAVVRREPDSRVTWGAPSPAGAEGLPALGEQAAVEAGLPDLRPPSREEVAELAGKQIVVVGSGRSAATAIGDLAAVVRREPGTRVTWALRRGTV